MYIFVIIYLTYAHNINSPYFGEESVLKRNRMTGAGQGRDASRRQMVTLNSQAMHIGLLPNYRNRGDPKVLITEMPRRGALLTGAHGEQ